MSYDPKGLLNAFLAVTLVTHPVRTNGKPKVGLEEYAAIRWAFVGSNSHMAFFWFSVAGSLLKPAAMLIRYQTFIEVDSQV